MRFEMTGAADRTDRAWFALKGMFGGFAALAAVSFGAVSCGAASDNDWGRGEGPGSDLDEVGTVSEPLQNGIVLPNGAPDDGAVLMWLWHSLENRWAKCSAQVISRNTILTAAHCFDQAGMSGETGTWKVAIVRHASSTQWQWLTSSSGVQANVAVHPDFLHRGFYDFTHDIAVVRAPSNFTNVVQVDAASIAKQAWTSFTGWAFGYGDYSPTQGDNKLRGAQIPITYNSTIEEFESTGSASSPQLCPGDSGGPLKSFFFSSHVVLGVAVSSFGGGSNECGRDGNWAPTGKNWQFIKNNVSNCSENFNFVYCW